VIEVTMVHLEDQVTLVEMASRDSLEGKEKKAPVVTLVQLYDEVAF
jgi:hypothetical protein